MKQILRISGWLILPFLFFLKINHYRILGEIISSSLLKLDIAVNFLIFLIIFNTIVYLLNSIYRKRKDLNRGQSDNLIVGVNNIYYLILLGAVLATLLQILGFDLFTFFTSLSIFAAALAVLGKDYISNIISGMLIAFSDEINIGDYVQIAGKKGKVTDITLSKFILLNDDDDYIILPNSMVFSNEIINYTRREIKKTSIDFEIDLNWIQSIEDLEKDLIESIAQYHHLIKPDSFRLKIVEIKKDYVSLKFQYTLNQHDRDLERDIRRLAIRRVVQVIKENQNESEEKNETEKSDKPR
jgi:small-conductance mechanosensitive channel